MYPAREMKIKMVMLSAVLLALLIPVVVHGEGKLPKGPPPAVVVVGTVEKGMLAPKTNFVGTVYYREVSELSAEVSGKVESFYFQEGDLVRKGTVLVRIDNRLLLKDIEAKKAALASLEADIEKAEKNFKRIESLFREDSVAEQVYDEHLYRLKSLRADRSSLQAVIERLDIELEKTLIASPFDGIIIKRYIDRGEWVSPGKSIASIARISPVDVLLNIPESMIRFVKKGQPVEVNIGGAAHKGRVTAIVPKADLSTRTIPVKISLKNNGGLFEGMEAVAGLPSGEPRELILLNRDAVLSRAGRTFVFAVVEGKAKMLPVEVVGYEGLRAGVSSGVLKPGMKVVVKGNERLRDGQPLKVSEGRK